jgi:hypothetical protein
MQRGTLAVLLLVGCCCQAMQQQQQHAHALELQVDLALVLRAHRQSGRCCSSRLHLQATQLAVRVARWPAACVTACSCGAAVSRRTLLRKLAAVSAASAARSSPLSAASLTGMRLRLAAAHVSWQLAQARNAAAANSHATRQAQRQQQQHVRGCSSKQQQPHPLPVLAVAAACLDYQLQQMPAFLQRSKRCQLVG